MPSHSYLIDLKLTSSMNIKSVNQIKTLPVQIA